LTSQNYDYKRINIPDRGFGDITHENKTVWAPNCYITCFLLNKKNECVVQEKTIPEESGLGRTLIKLNYSLRVKTVVCRQHPLFYDYESKQVKEYSPCHIIKSENEKIITDKGLISRKSGVIGDLQEALYDYWKLTNKYLIIELAENLIKWKKKNPVKAFLRKLNELKSVKEISEKRINNSYATLNNLLSNTK